MSARARRGSQGDLLAMEFMTADEGNMVKQFSPMKQGASGSPPQRRPRRLFEGGSPSAVADRTPYTASQPSSATSSLAAALADLQVSSRQSSASDLGDRSRVLAFAAAAARGGGGAAHSRSPSDEQQLEDGGLCSPQLIGAVKCFDSMVLRSLTPIKTRGRAGSAEEACDSGRIPAAPGPQAEALVSPFGSGLLKPKGPVGGRPVIIHTRGSSGMGAPGAYNPYDLTAAAFSSEFRSPARSLQSPWPCSSRAASTATLTPSPSQAGSGSHRGAAYRATAAAMALKQEEEEPDYYISVPGVRRQQSISQASLLGGPATAAKPAGPVSQAPPGEPAPPLQRAPSGLLRAGGSGGSSATLGSGTVVHGFKGLFRNVVVVARPSP